MNYEAMTVEELEKAIQALSAQREALKAQQQQAHDVLSAKVTAEAAAKTVANLDEAQKAALLQAIQSQGVGSSAVVQGMA